MTTGHVFIATSLDGHIARLDGRIDWLVEASASGEDHGYDTFVARMDGVIMGRETFETVLGFEPWPYSKSLIVLSRSMQQSAIPEALAQSVSIARSVDEALDDAERQGWRRAYVDGGATIQSFLQQGRISEMVVTRVPVILGEGRPLFGPLGRDVRLRHVETRDFPSGLVQSRYEVAA